MSLDNLPGPWRWEQRDGNWWRIHDTLNIHSGPYTEAEATVLKEVRGES